MNTRKYHTAYDLGIHCLNNMDTSIIENPAVMFDIDDTLLYSSPELQESGTDYIQIRPIINLLNECIKRRLIVLIITARDTKMRKDTIKDLRKNGINYTMLYLREDPRDNYLEFKSDLKKHLHKKGITTIMSIGDNLIDVIGDHSGYGLKLPNKKDPELYHRLGKNMMRIEC